MNGGSTNLDISSLTTGVSKAGLEQYLETLKTIALKETIAEIDRVDEVITAINNCWQGESRDRFLEAFAKMRELIKSDLAREYENLDSKMHSLIYEMYELDRRAVYLSSE